MKGFDVQTPDTPESIEMATKVLTGNRMPKMPDLGERAIPARKDPFALDDFGGHSPVNTTKP